MAWRLAKSLTVLRDQVNARFPGRAKASDGTIGDAAHAKRPSDHNPDKDGVVKALDLTTDPNDDADTEALAEHLRQARDPRVKYVIAMGRMFSAYAAHGVPAWTWQPYTGTNPHVHHFHVSVQGDAERYDDETPWNIDGAFAGVFGDRALGEVAILQQGAEGENVRRLQSALNRWGAGLVVDGAFGPATLRAVTAFQRLHGLKPDGIVGRRTWAALK